MENQFRFDWDDGNTSHLRRHRISCQEFEELLLSEPLDLEYETETAEERYKSLGSTLKGRILIAVWTIRDGRIRAITAYPATKRYRVLYLKHRGSHE